MPMSMSRDGSGCVVGMERREHEVTGQRRLNRHAGRVLVADLTDHDHVGVLTENTPRCSKLRPIWSFTRIWFTRLIWYSTGSSTVTMFRSGVLASIGCRIERGGLARARWSCDEQQAVRAVE